MVKKTITYTDYNGVQRTEDFYFNLTKAEVSEMELGVDGGLSAMIDSIIKAKNVPAIIKIFKELLMKSYGVKSADGRRFIKSPEITAEFMQTEAYSILFMELGTDAEKAADFVNAIVPSDLKAEMKEETKQENNAAALVPLT